MHISALSGAHNALPYLYDHGIFSHIDTPTSDGTTALHITAYFGDTKSLRYLLSKGADPNLPDNSGHTALHLAAQYGEVMSINILVSAGADIDAVTPEGDLALHSAASNGQDGAVSVLLKLGSSYAPNKSHMTPYLSACLAHHESTASLLQDHEVSNTGMLSSFKCHSIYIY